MAIREGKWKCTYCSVVNRGAELHCTGCGATRDKDVSFFVEEEAEEVQDAELVARAEAGADWLCAFCQTSNRPQAGACSNCGAERGTSPSRPVVDVRTEAPPSAPPPPSASWSRALLGCGVVGVVLLALGAFAFLYTHRQSDERVSVRGFEWERSIDFEASQMSRETAWEGQAPLGGREISREQAVFRTDKEQVGTQRVKVGSKNLGNGFFKDIYEDRPVYRDKPVYRTRIVYEVPRWRVVRTARAKASDQAPLWPDPSRGMNEREGHRAERYTAILEGRKTYRMDLPLDRWTSLHVGDSFKAVIQGGDKVLSLSP